MHLPSMSESDSRKFAILCD